MSDTLREGVDRLIAKWDNDSDGVRHAHWSAVPDLRALLAATAPTPDEVGQVEGLSEDEWADLWAAMRSIKVDDGAPVSLLRLSDEMHARHVVAPRRRAHPRRTHRGHPMSTPAPEVGALLDDLATLVAHCGRPAARACGWHGLPCRQHNCPTSWTEPGQ